LKIKTKINALLVSGSLLVALVGGVMFFADRDITANRQVIQANEKLIHSSAELRLLAIETILYREERASDQWQRKIRSIHAELQALEISLPEDRAALARIRKNIDSAEAIHTELQPESAPTGNATPTSAAEESAFAARNFAALTLVIQDVIDSADQLVRANRLKMEQSLRTQRIAFDLMLLAMLAQLAFMWRSTRRSILRPLTTFVGATQRVAAGDYTFRLNFTQQDEIGVLARRFDEMNARVQDMNETLRQREENISITLNSIGDAVIATDAQGLVTRMNPVAERLTGWPLADAIGQPLTAVFHIFSAETGLTAVNPVQQVMEHGQVVGLANGTALLARGGQEYRIADSAAPIRDASNTIVGVVLVFSDVTEKYQTDAALRVAKRQLETFFDHAPVAVAMFDRDMRYLFASRRWQQDYGIADRALRGVSHYAVFPQTTEAWKAIHRRALAGETVRADEGRFERSDGTVQWLHWEIRPWHEPGGEIGGVLLFTEDITKRKVAEDALHESEILGRAILDSVSAEIAVLDNEGTIVAVNAPWQRFASENSMAPGDPAPGTGVGSNYLAVCRADDGADHDDSARDARQGIQAVLSGDLPSFTLEHPCHAPDLQRWFSMSATPLGITGPGGGVVVAHTDITLRKLAEIALQAALKEKTALLNEVHHRVKNNLQVVTSLLRLERGRNTHAPTQAVLNDMQGRIRAMALLHESIYRAGTFAAIDLGAYASEIATQAFASLRTGTGTLRLPLDLSPVHVGLDQATTCGLLLTELISNALKHGFPDGGSGAIRIVLQRVVAPCTGSEIDQWRLSVSDTGVGLPANFAARQQESLGMQLAYGLASQLGGTLEAGPGDVTTGCTHTGASFGVTFTVTPPATLAIDL
jgi:PAS domain S-box-containing protein